VVFLLKIISLWQTNYYDILKVNQKQWNLYYRSKDVAISYKMEEIMKSSLPQNPNLGIQFKEENLSEIYLAGGCFWGVQAYYSRIQGVKEAISGYANGSKENPTYEEVCTGTTGHAETVKIVYDRTIVSLGELIERFFMIVDPTQRNRQGNDMGTQYRSGIYYKDSSEKESIRDLVESKRKNYQKAIVTEVEDLKCFYQAEEYHQAYLDKNPGGYCHINFDTL